MTETSPRPWRTGTSIPRNIYDGSPEPVSVDPAYAGPGGRDIGRMDRAEDAVLVVAAVNAYGEPGLGHHVLVTVDGARNCGSASISRRMVPLYAPLGLLLAGDTEETVREEYDLTEAELRLVAALAEEVRGFLAEREAVVQEGGERG